MVQQSIEFNAYVTREILADNTFGINKVEELISIRSIIFRIEGYPQIEQFVKDGRFELINESTVESFTKEYLEIMTFMDQKSNRYIVTVYDSDELWQDPEVIDIYHR